MADWDLNALLLRNIEFGIRGLQWQNSGGRNKPKPIELPERTRTSQPAISGSEPEVVQKLRNIGLIPAGATD